MTATLDAVASKKKDKPEPTLQERAAEELMRQAREQGLPLTVPDGLLKRLTTMVLETALDQEMSQHLVHEKNGQVINETGNVRNGIRAKTALTESTGEIASRCRTTGRARSSHRLSGSFSDGTFSCFVISRQYHQLHDRQPRCSATEVVLTWHVPALAPRVTVSTPGG